MKITAGICLLFSLLSLKLSAQQANITVNTGNATLKSVLHEIEVQSGYTFSYSSDLIDVNQQAELIVSQVSLEEALDRLFKGKPIDYRIAGKQILLIPRGNGRATISGYVREAGSGELLIGALVYTVPPAAACMTNAYGFYSLTLPTDSYTVQVSGLGYKSQTHRISLDHEVRMDVTLAPSSNLEEAIVTADAGKKRIQLNKVEVPVGEIRTVPMILGEKDVAKYMMLFPGIQKGNEGNGYIYVRGGGPDQNLILIDDAVIYNAYHFLGLASLFSGAELRSAELYKGGFSSRYGGRLSSVLDMSMKDGNREHLGFDATIGVISSRLMVEGPIQKGKSSFLLSARRSYLNQTSGLLSKSDQNLLDYRYYDVHAKVSSELGKQDRFMLSAYLGRDGLDNQSGGAFDLKDDGIEWGNQAVSLRWNHQFSGKVFSNTSLVSSHYSSRIAFGEEDASKNARSSSAVESSIQDYTLKYDMDWIMTSDNRFRFGTGLTRHYFKPLTSIRYFNPDSLVEDINDYSADEKFAYGEWSYKPAKFLEITSGIRVVNFSNGTNWVEIEPRFQIRYTPKRQIEINASYAAMNQFLHLITAFNGFGLPADAWVASDNRLSPQHADQVSLGMVVHDIRKTGIAVSVEGYYKNTQNVVAMREGTSFFQVLPQTYSGKQVKTWSELATQGNAESMGLEWMLRKTGERIQGHISYTLSRTTMQVDSINLGRTYFATFDRRHDLGVYLSYRAQKHWQFSGVWVYGTGNAITLPSGEYFVVIHEPGGTSYNWPDTYYDKKNGFRMQDYHRLDLSVQYTHQLFKRYTSIIELSVYNAYNRANPFFYQIESEDQTNGTGKRILQKVSLFPTIPSLSWTVKF